MSNRSTILERPAHAYERDVVRPLEQVTGISRETIGVVEHGKVSYPLFAATIDAPDTLQTPPEVLITAGVHGDEVAGVFAALRLLEASLRDRQFPCRFTVLPCINPSGLQRRTLETTAGENLNRLFGTGAVTPEVRIVEQYLARRRTRFLAAIDLHEISPKYHGEGFSSADNPREMYLYETAADPHRRVGRRVMQSLAKRFAVCRWPTIYHDDNSAGVVEYPEACRNAVYAERTTLDAFLNGRYTDHTFTTETPMGWPLEKRIAAQVEFVQGLVEAILGRQ
jgi:hypothetical protein